VWDALRESVGLRGYGQKDSLIEYKNEGYDMFLDMMIQMRRNVIYSMFMFLPAPSSQQVVALWLRKEASHAHMAPI